MGDAARTAEGSSPEGGGGYRWGVKDTIIAVLTVLLLVVAAVALRDLWPEWRSDPQPWEGEPVALFDLILDREDHLYLDLVFDHAVGTAVAGEVLEKPPVLVFPSLPGVWTWRETNRLRFEPSGGFPMASEFRITLLPERLLGEGQVPDGDLEYTVRTDQFLVESVEVFEEPAPGADGRVTLRGSVTFNYRVEPEMLAPRFRLEDPESGTVEVLLERQWRSKVVNFQTGEVVKGMAARELRLVIDGDLTPAEGTVSLGQDHVRPVPLGSRELLTVRSVTAEPGEEASVIRIALSSTVDAETAGKYVTVEGVEPLALSADSNLLLVRGAMAPGGTYKLTIDQGLPARDGAVLREAHAADVRFADLPPSFSFVSRGMFLPAGGPGNLALETMNIGRLELTVDRVYRNNLFFFFQRNGSGYFRGWGNHRSGNWHAGGDRIAVMPVEVENKRNRAVTTLLPLEQLTADETPGLYRLFLSRPGNWRAEQRWVLVTAIGAVAKQGRDDFLVWAVNNRTLEPVANARVTLLSDQNQAIGRGRTDGAGFWRLGRDAGFADQRPYMVTVEQGDDFTFLLLDQMRPDTSGLDIFGARSPGDGYTAYLYGERDIYRPGEELHGAVLVRDGRLAEAPPMPVVLRHLDPEGREVGSRRLTLDDTGSAEFDIELPRYSPTGHHSLELRAGEQAIGSYAFQVEEFVPDRIKVSVEARAVETASGGGGLAGQVTSAYLFGPPAADLGVETRVRLADTSFSPPAGFEGYSFRNDNRSFEDREIHFEEGVLDGEGRLAFTVELPPDLQPPSALEARVVARVMESGGRGVSALERMMVHPWPRYVGVHRQAEGYARPGEESRFDLVAVTSDGTLADTGRLRVELFRDRWHTVLRRTPAGTWGYQSTRDAELVEQTLVEGPLPAVVAFTPAEYGSHRVVVTDPETGASASVSFHASGWGYAPWALESPGRVDLDLDREEYRSGDVATVQVKAPFPGKLLLTVEGDRVLHRVVHELKGNTAAIELPVRADWRPNVHVSAVLVRRAGDLEPGGSGRAFGAVPLFVDRAANRLDLDLEVPETVRSESLLTVELDTVPGAVVTVAAVDEGILQLIAQETPDPFTFFYRKLALGVFSADSFSLLLPDLPADEAEVGGDADAGLAQHVRTEGIQRVDPVTFWSGLVRADNTGVVRTSFELPGFQGGLRVMAVAADGRRFGSAERMVRVRDPLVLTPTLPRVLSFGETLQVPVTLRNDTGADGEFRVALAAEGMVRAGADQTRLVTVPGGRERTVWFSVSTGSESGDIRFSFTAEGRGETARAEVGVPVRPDLPPLSFETAGPLETVAMEVPFDADADLRPATLQRTLQVGALPLIQFTGKLSSLLRYPYGCLEQRVSVAFPLIYLADLARELEPELLDPAQGNLDPEMIVQDTVRRASMHQVPNGGFSLWRGRRTHHPWASVYATHFLVEASRAGHPVDPALLRRALNHLQSAVKGKGRDGDRAHAELQRSAYALYVLARAGEPDLGTMDYLRERQSKRLGPEARGLLAAAYAASGSLEAAQELEAMIGEIDRTNRQTGKNFDSAVRNRALLLLALLDADPESGRIPELADRLARDARTDRWWSTQETGFVLTALGRLFRQQAERPPWSGTVTLAGEPLGRVSSDSPSRFALPAGDGPLRVEMDEGYEPGSAFYSLVTRGVPLDSAFKPSATGLEIERTFLDRAGAELDPGGLAQGDLVVIRTRLRSVRGAVENVVLVNLLPSCLEVENPRLESTESLPWIGETGRPPDHLDLRDDRILIFTDLPAQQWQTYYTLARAVSPGSFRLPPVHAEAMYDGTLRATGERGTMEAARRGPETGE